MAFADLFADNLIVQWLRGDRRRHDLAVAMVGLKLGERCLLIGCGDGGLLAALGSKVGYTGRACGTDTEAAAVARAERAAERAGVLVEVQQSPPERLPFEDESFDVVVVQRTGAASAPRVFELALAEAWRLLRPGGRCVVIRPSGPSASDVESLGSARFRGAHVLADREGQLFIEAVRARVAGEPDRPAHG
jgi:ubiquinone/menaquinone biosynthesis C-methylase UbiE